LFRGTHAHGFAPLTPIYISAKKSISIQRMSEDWLDESQQVLTFDLKKKQCVNKKVLSAATIQTDCYYAIELHNEPCNEIICTPEQLFYKTTTQQWLAARNLHINDSLLTKDNTAVKITAIRFVSKPLLCYAIRVRGTHNFFVGKYGVLAHNMLLPVVTTTLGLASGIGATSGCCLAGILSGPIGAAVGIVLGGCLGILVKSICTAMLPHHEKQYASNSDKQLSNENKDLIEQDAIGVVGGSPAPNDPNNWWQKKKHNKIEKNLEKNDEEKFRKSLEYGTNDVKLTHIFGKAKHGLNELLDAMGGRNNIDVQKKLVGKVIRELMQSKALPQEGEWIELPLKLRGETISVRFCLHEEIIKISTFFIRSKFMI
jgi:hypothetical protein